MKTTQKKSKPAIKKIVLPELGGVKNVKHAFDILNQRYAMPDVSKMPKKDGRWLTATYSIAKIIEAENKLNNNWKPDYHTANDKYEIWHYVKAGAKRPSGFGFSYAAYGLWAAVTGAGSRFCLGSRDHAMKVAKRHEKLFIVFKLK